MVYVSLIVFLCYVELSIIDYGVGFCYEVYEGLFLFGIKGMKEWVEKVGVEFLIELEFGVGIKLFIRFLFIN